MTAACRRAISEGYTAIKLHEIEIELIRAAREAVGPGYVLMADMNCPWTPEEARKKARELA
jgi:L-alanine-DL-glutamate epimerase-like enolase superfamily enzyme